MPMTSEQLRQVRLNQPRLSWAELESQFRRNWAGLIASSFEVSSESDSPDGPMSADSSPQPIQVKKPIVGCFTRVIG